MMKSILFPILLFLTFSSFAQNHLIGIKGGVNWTSISSGGSGLKSYFRTGYSFGITYENQLKENFLIGSELMYLQRGALTDVFIEKNGNIPKSAIVGKHESIYEYIALPIKGGYMIGSKISGFASIGFVPSYLLKATFYLEETISRFADETFFDFSESVPDFDFAGLVEIGGNAQITEKLFFNATLSFQHSLTPTIKTRKRRHYGMMLSGGIKYLLKGE